MPFQVQVRRIRREASVAACCVDPHPVFQSRVSVICKLSRAHISISLNVLDASDSRCFKTRMRAKSRRAI
jgi:hypothetical protein